MIASGVIRRGEETVGGDADALCEIGSITKAFTGTLLAEMAERGEVRLEDPLAAHLELPAWHGAVPTLLELATHASGLPNTPRGFAARELAFLLGLPGSRDPWVDTREEEFWIALSRTRRRRRRFRYSSVGFELLGRALAARARTPWDALVRERVCTPLGMNDTGVHVSAHARARLQRGHSFRGAPRPPLTDHLQAAGGLRSSVREMLRFLRACVEPSDDALGRALARAQRPHSRVSRRLSVGLGWLVLGDETVWHNGGTWGFRAFAGLVPARGRAAVVLSDRARSVDRRGFRLLKEGH
ncbi:MAG: beta-lactamase family protein [Thermoleophilia bacterium]|nr:beta-lactamase family protein [Thermoleophilia bacterium]